MALAGNFAAQVGFGSRSWRRGGQRVWGHGRLPATTASRRTGRTGSPPHRRVRHGVGPRTGIVVVLPATWRGVVDLGVGWAFLLTGFLATWRRPANRTGRLLTATGLSWYAGNLRFLGDAAGSPDLGARADDRRCARLPVHRRRRRQHCAGPPERAACCVRGRPGRDPRPPVRLPGRAAAQPAGADRETAVSRLVLELGQTPPPGKLQEA